MRKKLKLVASSALCKLFLSLSLILFFSAAALGQTAFGTVTGGNNKVVSGAKVTVKDTSRTTVTNDAGRFEINATGMDRLVVHKI